jgi:hypothetical protein
MTEAEWLAHMYAPNLPTLLTKPENVRRIRLFACASCRRLWHILPERGQQALLIAEQHADGKASHEDLAAAKDEAFRVSIESTLTDKAKSRAAGFVYNACAPSEGHIVDTIRYYHGSSRLANLLGDERKKRAAERGEQPGTPPLLDGYGNPPRLDAARWLDSEEAVLEAVFLDCYLRDIFGNPFRPVTFSPEWHTDTAVALARQMYEARDFSAMPILADALQDAGCDNEDILSHCRGPGRMFAGAGW